MKVFSTQSPYFNSKKTQKESPQFLGRIIDPYGRSIVFPIEKNSLFHFYIPDPKENNGRFLLLVRLREFDDDLNNLTQRPEDFFIFKVCKTRREVEEKIDEFLYSIKQAFKEVQDDS